MSISQQQYASGGDELLEILRSRDISGSSANSNQLDEEDQFALWFERMKASEWTRSDVHRLVRDILDRRPSLFSERTTDELGEFESALIGHCAPECILRFPGDPSDQRQLVAHVRGNHWR